MRLEEMKLKEINLDDSFYARKQVESLIIIYNIVDKQKKRLEAYEQTQEESEIIEKIRLITNEIYSGCEIINQLFISIYRNDDRYRGTNLKRGFNDNFKEVYNAFVKRDKEIRGVYKDKFISSFFYDARNWFIMLHDIRTQETHYEVGKIVKFDGKIYYISGNRNGTSKNLYTNPSDKIKLEIKEIVKNIEEFLKTEDKIAKLVISNSC